MSGCHICGRCRTADETQRGGVWRHNDCWDARAAQLQHANDYERARVAVLEANPHRLEEEPAKPGCSCGGTCNTCRIIAQYATKPPKAPWRLLPMEAMPYVLEALALGAAKYPGDADWRKRPDIETESWEAAMRHMSWLAVGTELDAEGPHHAACVIARMLFILAKYDERKKKTP